ncbi:hypothetical protein F4777DRAFT_549746 [Nemania sp. FL0916]|nr:hypothetical protein F4777DRAFT_549746 [Nemania sp. FL0916]
MSFVDEKKRLQAARAAEEARAEQAPIPVSSTQFPPQNSSLGVPRPQTRARAGSEFTIPDDTQNYTNGFLPESPELVADDDVLPAYSEFHDQLNIHQAGFDAGAAVTDDGRVNININQTSRQLADFIAPALRNQLRHDSRLDPGAHLPPPYIPPSLGGQPGQVPPPLLNVVIQIVGSRGDVQPFVALGQILKNTYGHRVRIATHATFQKFVEENGLEFFAIGGDPAELMAFMVKNPGLMPGLDALKTGEITKRRKGIEQIIMGCWRSCIETGDGLGPAPRFSRKDEDLPPDATPVMGDSSHRPFVADVIIANPPSFAHIHVAEKLGVPLHLMFTMPWSPTRAFPQPLANIQSSNTDPVTTNYLSYAMVEMMTWQGLGDVINRFRTKILDLEPLALIWAPGVLTRLRIPYTYCWSPALIPKPNDWGSHIDIAGFYFLNLASSYTPDPELAAFLAAGPPPVYIGFGSIVVDDPDGLTNMIFEAVAQTGVRALVSKGWGGLGADSMGVPDGVFMLGNVPHDWLFKHVSAVCHHGGAGTTAAGIQAGKPTIVVPFFGDQPFWGAMVARAGAGPDPIPYKNLTAEGLAEAIRVALAPETQDKAKELGEKIREERGADVGAQSFHQHLDVDALRCVVAPSRVAVWRLRRSKIHLSALAAATLVNAGYIRYSDLKLFRAKEYQTEDYPTDPISACTSALVGDATTIFMSAADIPRDLFKTRGGPPKSKSTENVDTEGVTPETSKDNETPLSASQSKDSDSTSVLSSTPSAQVSNGSASNLTPAITTASSTAPSASQQQRATRPEAVSGDSVNQKLERVLDTGKNINNIIATGVKSPMNFCLGMARGFRNAPNLYNDDTVRPTEKVTNLSSGLKVAGKEFGYGLFDGITGLFTQPIKGAEKGGGAGLIKGFGKGIGGFLLKPAAGLWSLPAYAMAGVHAEIRTLFAQSAHKYIVASRISQGTLDFNNSSVQEREDIEMRWVTLKDKLKGFNNFKQKEKGKSKDTSASVYGNASGAGRSVDQLPGASRSQNRIFGVDEKRAWREEDGRSVSTGNTPELDDEFETAIQAAVHETSRGNAGEDARIEQAIRSSVRNLRKRSATMGSSTSSTSGFPNTNLYPTGWLPDVKRPFPKEAQQYPFSPDDMEYITDEEYQALIEEAIKVSMTENQQQAIRMHDLEREEFDDDENMKRALQQSQIEGTTSHTDEEYKKALEASQVEPANVEFDEEALRKAIEASQAEQQAQHRPDADEELKRALEESEKAHEAELARINSLKSEEDIVLEYVKKQSLAEAAYRNAMKKNADVGSEDEELRRALEESMKTDDGIRRGGGGGPSQS